MKTIFLALIATAISTASLAATTPSCKVLRSQDVHSHLLGGGYDVDTSPGHRVTIPAEHVKQTKGSGVITCGSGNNRKLYVGANRK
jgi:hypothetical protein